MLLPELFANLAPKVFVVQPLDGRGRVMSFGSGVVVMPGHVVTNKHVVENAAAIRVKHGNRTWPAILTHFHPDHDICQVLVENLGVSPVQVRKFPSLSVGERVYAIGAPEGFDLTLSEGLISGLRRRGNTNVIQTTAPISRGSSGGGLFDSEGRLIGITTYFMQEGQSLNFAIAADFALTLEGYPFTGRAGGSIGEPSVPEGPPDQGGQAPSIDVPAQPAWETGDVKRLLETIAKAIVDQPDQVSVRAVDGDQVTLLVLRVHPRDLGNVVGKEGRVSLSIRTILLDIGTKLKRRFSLEIIE
jgi:predicted RNA-binding protein YlqC (UPF0109 family)